MIRLRQPGKIGLGLFIAALAFTCAIYWPGLGGTFVFDDYPNIVDNHGVQPSQASLPSLVNAALSSPASEFKRPLASLSFAANYLLTGLDPYWMKLTNLVIHLLNGTALFFLLKALVSLTLRPSSNTNINEIPASGYATISAAWMMGAWLLLPINLTAVLYVVQRMESLANLFVLLGLIGYLRGRRLMLASSSDESSKNSSYGRGLALCAASLGLGTATGLMAKETAVMLPLYAAMAEWAIFHFHRGNGTRDTGVMVLFFILLVLPLLTGLVWLLPGLASPANWATRDFTLQTRLLSEARILIDYIHWTILPTPNALSFYHDDFRISSGPLSPWTTLASIFALALLLAVGVCTRRRHPLLSLGLLWYLGCHLLTGTILPLELIYEHRNYFASIGLVVALIPPLIHMAGIDGSNSWQRSLLRVPSLVLVTGLFLIWAGLTAITAQAWGNPLRLAQELAERAPQSPRAQYELGRTYVIYSNYDPSSPFTKLAYDPLERAAAMAGSSILPQQALIFMNSRMHLPIKDAWWQSMIAKLHERKPGVQDESSLAALTQCMHEKLCDLPKQPMMEAFWAALSHPKPSARLLATYSDYAWNVLDDRELGLRMANEAVHAAPRETTYRITQIRMLVALGRADEAQQAYQQLMAMNLGGNLNDSLASLRKLPGLQ